MNTIQLNTDNLTGLWTLGGRNAGHFTNNQAFATSVIPNSDWPNKIWFHGVPDDRVIQTILGKQELKHMTISAWGDDLPETEARLTGHGFRIKSALTGMSLSLDMNHQPTKKLQVRRVSDNRAASKWADLFRRSFRYLIHSRTVEMTMDQVGYYIGYNADIPVGTAALFMNVEGVAGIHSMGILPEFRRNGFAEELLLHVLKFAGQQGARYATLQASDMGKGLYLRTGFKPEFQLKNFIKH